LVRRPFRGTLVRRSGPLVIRWLVGGRAFGPALSTVTFRRRLTARIAGRILLGVVPSRFPTPGRLVLLDLLTQSVGSIGDPLLLFGDFLRRYATFGTALNTALHPFDLFDLSDVVADACFLVAQSVGSILRQQQLQDFLQVVSQFTLVSNRPREFILVKQLDQCFQLQLNVPFLAERKGLLQQFSASWIVGRVELSQARNQFLQASVAIR
jgi:hypothetical protein